MAHTLGHSQYGKAETRVVRVYRDRDPHELVDLNVSVALSGDLADTHLTGDNAKVLTTDAVKNTVFAYAKEHPEAARSPESFGLALARHFVDDVPQVHRARVRLEQHPWLRLPGPHAFVREGQLVRTSTVTCEDGRAHVVSGLRDLVVLKTTDSEFAGFYEDRYTTLQPTADRVMATSVTAQWWHAGEDDAGEGTDWEVAFSGARTALVEAFAASYSLALQQTLFEMGGALLDAVPSAAEVRLSLPNRHHFAVDLSPFGLENPNEVFFAADRPYGLIEGTVRREGAADPGPAFDPGQGW
jgi:urate oxidase